VAAFLSGYLERECISACAASMREIEILFRRLRLYDQLGRRAEGLVRNNPEGNEGALWA
jgi:hypothetical protein